MKLSDAVLRQQRTKLIYPNHRASPSLTEVAARDRSNRLQDKTATLNSLCQKAPPPHSNCGGHHDYYQQRHYSRTWKLIQNYEHKWNRKQDE